MEPNEGDLTVDHYEADDRWFDAHREPCARCKTALGDILSGAWLCFGWALAVVKGDLTT